MAGVDDLLLSWLSCLCFGGEEGNFPGPGVFLDAAVGWDEDAVMGCFGFWGLPWESDFLCRPRSDGTWCRDQGLVEFQLKGVFEDYLSLACSPGYCFPFLVIVFWH
ncbi:hypothetical protein Dimus_033003 [Dionaea muscipula]